MKKTLCSLSLIALFSLTSCGEPTDRPEDCNGNEFFDEARSLCLSCPAVAEPTCDDGCGIEITTDDRGCPAAECIVADACETCSTDEDGNPTYEFYSSVTLACEPCDGPTTCESGDEPVRRVDGEQCSLQCP